MYGSGQTEQTSKKQGGGGGGGRGAPEPVAASSASGRAQSDELHEAVDRSALEALISSSGLPGTLEEFEEILDIATDLGRKDGPGAAVEWLKDWITAMQGVGPAIEQAFENIELRGELEDAGIDPDEVTPEDMQSLKAKIDAEAQAKRSADRATKNKKARAQRSLDAAVAARKQELQRIKDNVAKAQAEALAQAARPDVPGSLKVRTWRTADGGAFQYPWEGVLTLGSRTYSLAPNRGTTHAREELGRPNAVPSRDKVTAYLKSFVEAALLLAEDLKRAQAGATVDGRYGEWHLIGKRNQGQAEYSGEIFHADTGYERSPWRRR